MERTGPLTVVSLGAGRCELEIELTQALRSEGHEVMFTCVDLNPLSLEAGRSTARSAGLSESMRFVVSDVNRVSDLGQHDAIIAAQCLHHFVELEAILDSVRDALTTDGLFLVSDMIGRNGHQMWPEALEVVQTFWRKLPARLRTESHSGRVLAEYDNISYADVGFEGIKAQDILPLLVERFEFEVFAPFACVTTPFVNRRFGWSYDADSEADRTLVDQVATTDQKLMDSGEIKPTQLVAAMSKGSASRRLSTTVWSPRESIRVPG
ncbi:MAG: methyltransferase domain-containing protein [Pseudomonadota bacterium]